MTNRAATGAARLGKPRSMYEVLKKHFSDVDYSSGDEGRVYVCGWERMSEGFRLWVHEQMPQLVLRVSGVVSMRSKRAFRSSLGVRD